MGENRIGSERMRLRVSQRELSAEMGVSNRTVSLWERDATRCPPERLIWLAKRFDCSVDYLLGQTNERNH